MQNQLKLITAYIRKAKRECPIVVMDTDDGKRLDKSNKFAEMILDSFDLPYCDYIFKIINSYYPYDDVNFDEDLYALVIRDELIKAKKDLEALKDIPPEEILRYAARDYDPDDAKCKANNILPLLNLKEAHPSNFYHYFLYYVMLIEKKEPVAHILKELYATDKYCWLLLDFYYEHDVETLNELRKHLRYIDSFVDYTFMKYMELQKGYFIPKFLEKRTNLWHEIPEYFLSSDNSVDAEYFYKNLALN